MKSIEKKKAPHVVAGLLNQNLVKDISSTSGPGADAATKMLFGMYAMEYHNCLKIKNPSAWLKDT